MSPIYEFYEFVASPNLLMVILFKQDDLIVWLIFSNKCLHWKFVMKKYYFYMKRLYYKWTWIWLWLNIIIAYTYATLPYLYMKPNKRSATFFLGLDINLRQNEAKSYKRIYDHVIKLQITPKKQSYSLSLYFF